jgi:5-methylcytosine-specific restriction endonuclease McrA
MRRLRVPAPVAVLLATALEAARREAGRRLSDSECLRRVAAHFLDTWSGLPAQRRSPQRAALERDGHRCQVPGCSRAAVHAHHIVYRSRGGSDEPENLVSLCAAHHLHGVHRGWVRVRGAAPDGLAWELGEVSSPLPAR